MAARSTAVPDSQAAFFNSIDRIIVFQRSACFHHADEADQSSLKTKPLMEGVVLI